LSFGLRHAQGSASVSCAWPKANGFCRAPCEIDGPAGSVSVTPGVVYRRGGFDVAAVLDDWQETGELPPNISIR
jgi:hypothetical protein